MPYNLNAYRPLNALACGPQIIRQPPTHQNDCILSLDVLPGHVLQLLHNAGWLAVNGHFC